MAPVFGLIALSAKQHCPKPRGIPLEGITPQTFPFRAAATMHFDALKIGGTAAKGRTEQKRTGLFNWRITPANWRLIS
jgi:hypothetical protein